MAPTPKLVAALSGNPPSRIGKLCRFGPIRHVHTIHPVLEYRYFERTERQSRIRHYGNDTLSFFGRPSCRLLYWAVCWGFDPTFSSITQRRLFARVSYQQRGSGNFQDVGLSKEGQVEHERGLREANQVFQSFMIQTHARNSPTAFTKQPSNLAHPPNQGRHPSR